MSRIYVAPFDFVTLTTDADQDIWQMVMAANIPGMLHAFHLSSATTSDERLRLRLVRRTTSGTGGGTALTAAAVDQGNTVAAQAVVTPLVLAPGTLGPILMPWIWSQLSPFDYLPTPECRETMNGSSRLCLNLQSAVSSPRNISGWVKWEEQGG